jgi:hypothetical protein
MEIRFSRPWKNRKNVPNSFPNPRAVVKVKNPPILKVASRVTRWVCEKIDQNAARPIYCQICNKTFMYSGKSSPKFWATSRIFKKPPNRRKSRPKLDYILVLPVRTFMFLIQTT